MRVLVTGVNGQLGHDVVPLLLERGHEVIGSGSSASRSSANGSPAIGSSANGSPANGSPAIGSSPSKSSASRSSAAPSEKPGWQYRRMDITDKAEVDEVMDEVRPDLVVHCAAWTAVDAAEDPENFDRVMAVNADGTRFLAEACRRCGAAMIYISTDYVFDGKGTAPWQADCEDFAPQNVYGRSKLAGEQAVRELLDRYYIVRIAWVFGINGGNFIKTMMKLGETHKEIRVVSDQIGTPTYTKDLARLLADMAETERYGTYHATNEGGYISWYDLAVEVFKQTGQPVKVIPVTTAEYGVSKAARPLNSRLDKSRLTEQGFELLPDWRDAVRRFLREMAEQEY